jgi:predicted DNA-binding transcriptional regulator AlpA
MDTTPADDSLMTVKAVCKLLGISPDTFYRWRQLGKAPHAILLPNGSLRIAMSDYRQWLDSLRGEAA